MLDGNRLERPNGMPRELFDIMSMCWVEDPLLRPSFHVLHSKLEVLMQAMDGQQPHHSKMRGLLSQSDSVSTSAEPQSAHFRKSRKATTKSKFSNISNDNSNNDNSNNNNFNNNNGNNRSSLRNQSLLSRTLKSLQHKKQQRLEHLAEEDEDDATADVSGQAHMPGGEGDHVGGMIDHSVVVIEDEEASGSNLEQAQRQSEFDYGYQIDIDDPNARSSRLHSYVSFHAMDEGEVFDGYANASTSAAQSSHKKSSASKTFDCDESALADACAFIGSGTRPEEGEEGAKNVVGEGKERVSVTLSRKQSARPESVLLCVRNSIDLDSSRASSRTTSTAFSTNPDAAGQRVSGVNDSSYDTLVSLHDKPTAAAVVVVAGGNKRRISHPGGGEADDHDGVMVSTLTMLSSNNHRNDSSTFKYNSDRINNQNYKNMNAGTRVRMNPSSGLTTKPANKASPLRLSFDSAVLTSSASSPSSFSSTTPASSSLFSSSSSSSSSSSKSAQPSKRQIRRGRHTFAWEPMPDTPMGSSLLIDGQVRSVFGEKYLGSGEYDCDCEAEGCDEDHRDGVDDEFDAEIDEDIVKQVKLINLAEVDEYDHLGRRFSVASVSNV